MKLTRDQMTDTQKFWADVNRTGEQGAHSHDLAASIPSLNVSQRAKDCASKGQEVFTASEGRNGRNGARYWIGVHNAPDYAVPVRPNGADVGGEVESPASSPGASPAADVSVEALVLDFTGEAVRGAEVLPFGTRVYTRRAA